MVLRKIVIHDYPGYAFPIQLSRLLAHKGHEVIHLYSANVTAPRGTLDISSGDSPTLKIVPVKLPGSYNKDSFRERYLLETKYGAAAAEVIADEKPDIVFSANSPTLVSKSLIRCCLKNKIAHVNWVQDLLGIAAKGILSKKIPVVGSAIGSYLISIDQYVARNSDAHIVITDDFRPILEKWGVSRSSTHLIQNWAPLDEMSQYSRENQWSRQHLSENGKLRFIYSGTLAMKHNPQLLLELAKQFDKNCKAELIVVSEGKAIDWLREAAKEQSVRSLTTMPFQQFIDVPYVLSSADVLVVILEPEASVYSVPSKILSYFCAGKPILGAIPEENLAARTIVDSKAGYVASPLDYNKLLELTSKLCNASDERQQMGENGRRYSEETFDTDVICNKFESVIDQVFNGRDVRFGKRTKIAAQ